MQDWILYNSLIAIALAAGLKIASGCVFLQRHPNWLLLGWVLVLAKLLAPPLISLPVFDAIERHAFFSTSSTTDEANQFSGSSRLESFPAQARARVRLVSQSWPEELDWELSDDSEAGSQAYNRLDGHVSHEPTASSLDDWGLLMSNLDSPNQAELALIELSSSKLQENKSSTQSNWPSSVQATFLTIWLVGILLLLIHRYRTHQVLGRIAVCGVPLDHGTVWLASAVSRAESRVPPVVRVRVNLSPALVGLRSPKIILPDWAAEQLSTEELRAVLLHEYEHYRRRDHWLELIAWLLTAFAWWNPMSWWAYREMRQAQELCCDSAVVNRGLKVKQYALALWRVLELLQQHSRRRSLAIGGVPILPNWTGVTMPQRFSGLGLGQRSDRCSSWLVLMATFFILFLVCYPSLAEPQRSPDSFVYETLPEPVAVTTWREAEPNWPSSVRESQVLQELDDYEIVSKGHVEFGQTESPLLLAIVQKVIADNQDIHRSSNIAVDANRDLRFSPDELHNVSQSNHNMLLLTIQSRSSHELASESPQQPLELSGPSQPVLRMPDYKVWVRWEPDRWLLAQAGLLKGYLVSEGQTYSATLIDCNCNGNWSDADDRLLVDWDQDKNFSPINERYSCQQIIKRSGSSYSLAFGTDTLTLEPITGSGKLQLTLPVQNDDTKIEQFYARLTSRSGVMITVDQVNQPTVVPAGEYSLNSLSFRLKSDQVWSFTFSRDRLNEPTWVTIGNEREATLDVVGQLSLAADLMAGKLDDSSSARSSNDGEMDDEKPKQIPSVNSDNSPPTSLIVQPVLRTGTGLFLTSSRVGEHDPSDDNTLIATKLRAFGSFGQRKSMKSTGFGCGTFCPIHFDPDSPDSQSQLILLQFDSGPLSGKLFATLGGKSKK